MKWVVFQGGDSVHVYLPEHHCSLKDSPSARTPLPKHHLIPEIISKYYTNFSSHSIKNTIKRPKRVNQAEEVSIPTKLSHYFWF